MSLENIRKFELSTKSKRHGVDYTYTNNIQKTVYRKLFSSSRGTQATPGRGMLGFAIECRDFAFGGSIPTPGQITSELAKLASQRPHKARYPSFFCSGASIRWYGACTKHQEHTTTDHGGYRFEKVTEIR